MVLNFYLLLESSGVCGGIHEFMLTLIFGRIKGACCLLLRDL